jgi:hypothetical protein
MLLRSERLGDGDLSAGEIEIPMLQKEPAQIKKSPRDPEEPRSKSHHRQGTPVISDSLSPNAKEGPSHDSVLSHKPGLISEAPKTDEDTDTIIRNASKPPTDHPQTLPSLNEVSQTPSTIVSQYIAKPKLSSSLLHTMIMKLNSLRIMIYHEATSIKEVATMSQT